MSYEPNQLGLLTKEQYDRSDRSELIYAETTSVAVKMMLTWLFEGGMLNDDRVLADNGDLIFEIHQQLLLLCGVACDLDVQSRLAPLLDSLNSTKGLVDNLLDDAGANFKKTTNNLMSQG